MYRFLPAPLIGLIASLCLVLNTLLLAPFLMLVSLCRLILPIDTVQTALTRVAIGIASLWISINSLWMRALHPMDWQLPEVAGLDQQQWFFVISNHQSWADIFITQHLLNRRIPMLKFFLKQQLIWVPVIGLCWWALDFPFMQRYSAAYLKKYPHKKGKDYHSTLKACAKFKRSPVAVMNYLEGTRFTVHKQQQQVSPYRYLLKPKAGGIGYALSAMGDNISQLLNISIFYADHQQPSFWQFLCGRVNHVSVAMRCETIPAGLLNNNYIEDRAFRSEFNQWVNELWQQKDQQIATMHHDSLARGWSSVAVDVDVDADSPAEC